MVHVYIKMPLYDITLHEYLDKLKGIQKMEKIMDVASKIVENLKFTHCAKRTYNDLKLHNVMINLGRSLDEDPEVFLIDFGFARKYLKKDGKTHIEESSRVEMFQGNLVFSSER